MLIKESTCYVEYNSCQEGLFSSQRLVEFEFQGLSFMCEVDQSDIEDRYVKLRAERKSPGVINVTIPGTLFDGRGLCEERFHTVTTTKQVK